MNSTWLKKIKLSAFSLALALPLWLSSVAFAEVPDINWGHLTQEEIKQIADKITKVLLDDYVKETLAGLKAYSKGDLDKALIHFTDAKLDTNIVENGYPAYYLGLIYYKKHRFEDAKRSLIYALKDTAYFHIEYPDHIGPAYGALGLTYAQLKENDNAIKSLEKALELKFDKNPFIYRVLGHGYYQKKQLEKSVWAMEMAIKLDPKYADNYADIAFPYRDLGQRDKAIASLKKFLELTSRPADDPGVMAVKKAIQTW